MRGRALRASGGWQALGAMDFLGTASGATELQAALLVLYLLERYGGVVVAEIWKRTALRGRREVVGTLRWRRRSPRRGERSSRN